mgnify:CR=1 FL=1
MVTYIIQLSVFLLLFWGVYELFLKKETFFTYNRWYLLLTPIISALLPFLSFNVLESYAVEAQQLVQLPAVFIGDPVVQEIPNQTVTNPTNSISFFEKYAWWLAYGLGVLISLSLFIKKIFQFQQFRKQGRVTYLNDLKLVEVNNSSMACTFFKTIYLGSDLAETEKAQILKHEQVHAQQYHSLDLLFFEILKIAIWFNPVVYFYQKQITNLHEYIADAEATKNSDKKSYYESLLNVAFGSEQISFINQFFSHSLIKKRIIMLQKNQSSNISKFKFLLIVPMLMLMLTYVACSDDNSPEQLTTADVKGASDEELKQSLRDELKIMQEEGVEFFEIADAFMIEKEKHVKSKEAFYRFQVYLEMIHQNAMERSMRDGTYNKEEDKEWQNQMNQTYDEYVAYRKSQPVEIEVVEDNSAYDNASEVPFAVIDKVPAFQECDQWVNDARKNCTSSEISKFVNKNFNTSLGKELGLKGVNRVIVQFRIDENGQVQDIKSRAPHPRLEEEAKRVISELPSFIPGEQNGKPVSVMYSLPIAFKVQ